MTLEDQISSNKRKSMVVFFLVPLLFLGLVYVVGFVWTGDPFIALIIGIVGSLAYTLITFASSEKLILSSVGAKLADPVTHKRLFDLMEGLTLSSGMPMPKLYVQKSDQINAFATGRTPELGIICVTTGCLEKLKKDELEGVLAHELAHIKNYDIRLATIVVALVGGISILANIFLRSLWFGAGGGDKNRGGGQVQLIMLVVGILLAILAPIFARLVQLAVSRKREYLADATGAHMTRYPDGLARALEKIKLESTPMKVERAVSSLYLGDPFKKKVQNLWSTHPPVDDRIRRLREM